MELTLEIAEGAKYDNLINEIEEEFIKNYKKANYYKKNNDYEKLIRYYEKCLILDSDHTLAHIVNRQLEYYVNKYYENLYTLGKKNYYNYNFDISKFYLVKCYCLFSEYKDILNNYNFNCQNDVEYTLDCIQKKWDTKVKDINENSFEKIII